MLLTIELELTDALSFCHHHCPLHRRIILVRHHDWRAQTRLAHRFSKAVLEFQVLECLGTDDRVEPCALPM